MDSMIFFRAFLRNWKEVGWPLQTSHRVARKICDAIDFQSAQNIVEIGAGLGNVTKEILKSLKPDAHLIVFEIDEDLCRRLQTIQDRRLVVYNVSGFELPAVFTEKADYVISEIPIATLSPDSLSDFYSGIKTVLRDSGSCLQLQLSLLSYRRVKRYFKDVRVVMTLGNLPPLFIYCCRD